MVRHKHVMTNNAPLKMIVIIWYLAKAGMLFLAVKEYCTVDCNYEIGQPMTA